MACGGVLFAVAGLRRLLEEKSRSQDGDSQKDDADHAENIPPARPRGYKVGEQRTEQQAAHAEAGQQDAGNKTTPARKPVDHSGQPGVIANTDARAHKDPVKKVESKKGDRTGAAQKAGYRQSDPQHQSGFLRQAGCEHAVEGHSYKEAEHGEGVGHRGLCAGPAKFGLKGHDKNRPDIDKAKQQQRGHTADQDRNGVSHQLLHRSQFLSSIDIRGRTGTKGSN